jgi:hypothetical protein
MDLQAQTPKEKLQGFPAEIELVLANRTGDIKISSCHKSDSGVIKENDKPHSCAPVAAPLAASTASIEEF